MQREKLYADIRYSVIALGLPAPGIAQIIGEAIGITVDPASPDFLARLTDDQLKAVAERLSERGEWQRSKARAMAKGA